MTRTSVSPKAILPAWDECCQADAPSSRTTLCSARLLLALSVVVVVGVVAGRQSGADSVFEKVSAAWPFMLGLGSGVGAVLTWLVVGPRRLRLLGMKLPFQR